MSPYTPERIRSLRGERSRAEFAELLGVTPLTVYRWELPDDAPEARRPRGRILERLRRATASPTEPGPPASAVAELAPEDEALLLPLFNSGFRGAPALIEERLIHVLSSGALVSHAGRALATAAVALFRVTTTFDARGAYAALAPVLREADAGTLPPLVELYARVGASVVFSSFDGSLFDIGKVNAQIERGAPLAERLGEPDLHFVLLVGHAAASLQGGTRDWGERTLRRLEELRGHITGPLTEVLAEEMNAYAVAQRGDRGDIDETFAEVSRRAEEVGLVTAAVRAGAFALLKGVHLGRPPRELAPKLPRVRQLIQRHRLAGGIHTAFLAAAETEILTRMGDFPRACESILRCMQEVEELHLAPVPVVGPYCFLRRHLSGETAALLPPLDVMMKALSRGRLPTARAAAHLLAALDRFDGGPASLAELARAETSLAETDPNDLARSYLGFAPLEARLAAGHTEAFEEELGALERTFEECPIPVAVAKVRAMRGLHAAMCGRTEEGRQLLVGALTTFAAVEHLPETLHTRVHLARLSVVERRDGAEDDLEGALVACARVGLMPPPELPVRARAQPPRARERDRAALAGPIERLSGRGVSPRVVLRELAALVEELWPDVAFAISRADEEHDEVLFSSGGAAIARPLPWELADGAGGRYRLTLDESTLPDSAPEVVRALVTVASLSIELATLRAATAPGVAPKKPGRSAAAAAIVASSGVMRQLLDEVDRLSGSSATVLLSGESGAGKEVIARAIHDASARRAAPYMTFNCGSVPRDLFEGQLFGYRRGAFTGATADHPGVIRAAHGGTLFLDEVAELSPRAQAKLLRTLQEGEVRRIGETAARAVDVRVVSATNRPLRDEVAAGRFRLDLRYRLDVLRIEVPPLRQRPVDVPVLVTHFWAHAMERLRRRARLSASVLAVLAGHPWPGNARELQNAVAAIAAAGPTRGLVTRDDLPEPWSGCVDLPTPRTLAEARRAFERAFVAQTVERVGARPGVVARELGVTRQGLAKLTARLGLPPPRVAGGRDEGR